MFRAFRLMRLFKLARSWGNLRELLITIVKTIKALGNFCTLMVLYVFIMVLLSMEFFAHRVKSVDGVIIP